MVRTEPAVDHTGEADPTTHRERRPTCSNDDRLADLLLPAGLGAVVQCHAVCGGNNSCTMV